MTPFSLCSPYLGMTNVRGSKLTGMFGADFFTQRVVGACNTLPGVVLEADIVVLFKRLLGRDVESAGSGLKMDHCLILNHPSLLILFW